MLNQPALPDVYLSLSKEDLESRIVAAKQKLGESLCILGHHYQRDDVIRFADLTGDSLKLSQQAAAQSRAQYIVFCGVHFMAESSDVLTGDDQVVILPHLAAGCSMAEMAEDDDVADAIDELQQATGAKIVPITYVNSSAAIKAVTASAGGACCTSSNVRNVFEWALRPESEGGAGAEKIFAVPDEHLARNTAVAMGYSLDECAVYDPMMPNGGLTAARAKAAKFFLWRGHCYVHMRFTPDHVAAVRNRHEKIQVIVHPECRREVVRAADAAGSTEQIIRAVEAGQPGSQWAVGTESNLVNRLAKRLPDRFVRVLSDLPATCVQMGRIDLSHLAWVLDNLVEGKVVNQIRVDSDIAASARIALKRMIDIKAVAEVTPNPSAGGSV